MSGAYTPQVQEAVTRLGSRLPYGEAREEMERMWGVTMTTATVRQITMRNGRLANDLIEREVARLEQETPRPTARPKQLLVSADGAMVQLTSGEWREVKTVAFGEFQPEWQGKKRAVQTRTTHISYFSRVEPAEAFTRSALYEWQRRGGENAQRVVAANDGAIWIQSFLDYHCPQATRVIDFAHAQSYVAIVGKAIYGAESREFHTWYQGMSRQLGHKPPQRTLSDLRFLQQQHPDHPQMSEIERAIRYLEKRRSMIDYPHFRKIGIPIGSGMVESGHKVVMQRRMKQAGMRWAEVNLNPMLALRMALCNNIWDENWRTIRHHSRQIRRDQRLQKAQPFKPKPQPARITEADCQRLERLVKRKRHPWKNHDWIFPHRR